MTQRKPDRRLGAWTASLLLACLATASARAGTFTSDFSALPSGAQIYGDQGDGNAGIVEEGVLKLTKAVASQSGSMVIDDLDAGKPVSGFTATFKLLIGGGSGADGFSFNFGPDVADATFGEEGTGTGLTVSFDSYDNGGGEAPAIDVKVGGTEVATTKIAPRSALAANAYLPVRINLDSDGTIDVSYGNTVIYTNLYTGYVAAAGRFAFGARTGGSHDNHFVDDLSITTSTAPQTQPAHPLVMTVAPSGSAASPEAVINITVKDFATQLTTSSVKLKLNNAAVTPTVTKAGDTTTITYDPPGLFASESVNMMELVYADSGGSTSTNNLSFKVTKYKNVVLPSPLHFESFDTTAEGQLPAGWVQTNLTDSLTAGIDFEDANSDAYLGWTVVDRSRLEGTPFDARRLNVAPGYLNGVLVTNLVWNRSVYAESDNRGGNQIQMLFTPDFNLSGKTDVYVSYNSYYEQNQDSLGAVEYSTDKGATWNPVVIMLDGPDIVRKADGTVDAATTLNTVQTDTPQVDDGAGGTRRTAYGEFLASTPLDALGPYIEERVNDNATESKRIELFRLAKADNQATVRFRFVQAGTGSWYFGIDNFGLYSIPSAPTSPELVDFQFNEGKGTNTVDAASKLIGILGTGMQIDPGNVPAVVTDTPSGGATDRALSLNAGSATTQAALMVNDSIAPILAFGTNAPFTMEAWVNIGADDTRTYEGLGAYGFSYKLGFNNQQLQFTLYGIVDINSGIKPTKGEWHHVAAVWKPGTGVEFFLDGTSRTNIAETRVPRAYRNNILTIGAENVGAAAMANSFQGKIDRFRMHGAALTADQLDSVAATTKAVLSSTLVAYNFSETNWPFASAGTTPRPAVPNSAPAWTTDTPSGQAGDFALSFAPGTQVVVGNPENKVQLDTNNPSFTMQAWVNFPGNPATRQVLYYNNGPGGAVSFSVFTNRTIFVTTLGVKDQSSNAKIPDDGKWHHLAVVHENKKEFRFYVDGALADTQAYTGSVIFTRTNQVFYLGSEPTFGLQYTGKLDRVKVTKGMLTPEELDYPSGGEPTGPEIGISRTADGLVITFQGTLEAAEKVTGPYTTVPGTSPVTVKPTGQGSFYRAKQ